MSGNRKRGPAAALAAGVLALAALIGCGREESVASKSAAAFEEAQKRGETFGGGGHHGGHGAAESSPMSQEKAAGEEHARHGDGHSGGDAGSVVAATQHQHGHAGMGQPQGAQGAQPADHSMMGHGEAAHAGGHAGHGAPAPQAPAGHAGHSPSGGGTPSAPVATLPTQPASILRPDALDAPAAASVADAQRSAEMNQAMSGSTGGRTGDHGGYGAGTYRHVDAGRGPGAYEGSEPQTPGAAGPQHHDHGSAEPQTAFYVCPMHREVTRRTPGTCPKCGMTLVERRVE